MLDSRLKVEIQCIILQLNHTKQLKKPKTYQLVIDSLLSEFGNERDQ